MRPQVSPHAQSQVNPDSSARQRATHARGRSRSFCQQPKRGAQIQHSAHPRMNVSELEEEECCTNAATQTDRLEDKDRNLRNQAKCHLSAPG